MLKLEILTFENSIKCYWFIKRKQFSLTSHFLSTCQCKDSYNTSYFSYSMNCTPQILMLEPNLNI
jgi:hypothetical protein